LIDLHGSNRLSVAHSGIGSSVEQGGSGTGMAAQAVGAEME